MEATDPVFLGMDLAATITIPTILVLFAFAVWFGVTRCTVGIGAEEQERRMAAPRRSSAGAR